MEGFAEFSSWLQMVLIISMIVMAYRLSRQFPAFHEWRSIWWAFGLGFAGMWESRILVILFAYEVETPLLRFMGRFITPLQAILGLSVGMFLLSLLMHKIEDLRAAIHLPHPAGFVVDADSVVLAWDAGAEALFGWTAAEALGHTLMDLITPARIKAHHTPVVERYLQSGQAAHGTQRFTVSARYRDTAIEFSIELQLTAESTGDAPRFLGVARRLMPTL